MLSCFSHVDCSLPDSSVHGILQARILEWVAISSSRGGVGGVSSQPKKRTQVSMSPALAGGDFTTSATWVDQKNHSRFSVTVRKTLNVLANTILTHSSSSQMGISQAPGFDFKAITVSIG